MGFDDNIVGNVNKSTLKMVAVVTHPGRRSCPVRGLAQVENVVQVQASDL